MRIHLVVHHISKEAEALKAASAEKEGEMWESVIGVFVSLGQEVRDSIGGIVFNYYV